MRVTFFRVAERKSPKKGRPYCARPFAALRATCDARTEGAPQNSLRATRSVQTTAASQCTKCVCPSAHARPPCPALLGARRREPQNAHPHGPLLRCAALGLTSRAQAPRAAQTGPSAAMARAAVRLFGCWMFGCLPLLAAPAAGRLRGAHGRRSAHASSTDSPWLSERRAQHKASSTAHPANDPPQVCPGAKRRGRRLGVAFSLVTFFWRSKRKLLACRATPGLRPRPRQAARCAAHTRRSNQNRTTKSIATCAYPTSASSQ